MRITTKALVASAFLGLSLLGSQAAFAQTKIFVIDENKIRAESKLGKEMSGVLGAASQQGAEKLGLKTLDQEIKTEATALQPQTQALTKEALAANPTLKAKVDALNKKQNEFYQKAGTLDQALGEQSQRFNAAFAQVLEPAVSYVAKQQAADLVLSKASTWYYKDAIDISSKVVARLDATIPNLQALQAALTPPQAAAAPGAAPAAPAAKPPGTP